jgi:hypothetical protein
LLYSLLPLNPVELHGSARNESEGLKLDEGKQRLKIKIAKRKKGITNRWTVWVVDS